MDCYVTSSPVCRPVRFPLGAVVHIHILTFTARSLSSLSSRTQARQVVTKKYHLRLQPRTTAMPAAAAGAGAAPAGTRAAASGKLLC